MSTIYGSGAGLALALHARPLPNVADPVAAPHWAAAREERLLFQRCKGCGYTRWPAAKSCPECLGEEAEWTQVDGGGELWSFCTYEHALHPPFEAEVPYVVAGVQLDAGPFMITNIVGPIHDLVVGQRVEVAFTHLTDAVTLVNFKAA
jgi:uncharacterized protein